MKVQCVKLEYTPYKSDTVNSYSRKDPSFLRGLKIEGWNIFQRSGAVAHISMPAKLVVKVVSEEGKEIVIDVASFFRQRWGRLTQKRCQCICSAFQVGNASMVNTDEEGNTQYLFSEEYLNSWLSRAQQRK